MIKLSKISKVILISGILLAFSGLGSYSKAQTTDAGCESRYTKGTVEYNVCIAKNTCNSITDAVAKEACQAKAECLRKSGAAKTACEAKANCISQYKTTKSRQYCQQMADCTTEACKEKTKCELDNSINPNTDTRTKCLAKAQCYEYTGTKKTDCLAIAENGGTASDAVKNKNTDDNTASALTACKNKCVAYTGNKKTKCEKDCETTTSALGVEAEYTDKVKRTTYTSDNGGGTTVSSVEFGGQQTSNSTGWYAARDARDEAQADYQKKSVDYNTCVATKSATDPQCMALAQEVATAKNTLNDKTKEYNQAQKDASKAANKEAKAQAKAENKATKDYNKAEKSYNKAQNSYNKAQTDYINCLAKNNNDETKCTKQKEKVDKTQGKLKDATADYQEKTDTYNTVTGQNKDPLNNNKSASGLDAIQQDLQNARNSTSAANGVDEDAQLQAFNNLKNYSANKQQEAAAAQAKCDSYSGMTSQAAQAKAREACATAKSLNEEAAKAKQAVSDEFLKSKEAVAAAAAKECEGGNEAACSKQKNLEAEAEAIKAYQSEGQQAVDAAAAATVAAETKATEACAADHTSQACKDAQAELEAARAKENAMRKASNDMLEISDSGDFYDAAPTTANQVINARKHLSSDAVKDISKGRTIKISPKSSGTDTLSGYRSKYFIYDANGDVLETVTRRAALAVVSLKPIVYVFAGFGLIAFAWMAIFNKISWKWFANIAMGLFLVANMGRLIEYLVSDGTGSGGFYVGTWDDSAKKYTHPQTSSRRLANAFKDAYYVYGDTANQNDVGIRVWKIGSDGQLQEYSRDELMAGASKDGFSASAAGFCKGTSGSGFANFTSCMGDILSTVKKTTQTIQTVKAAAEDMVARVETVADTAKNIAQTAKNIAKAAASGDVTGVLANMGNMMNQANSMVSTTTGAVGSLTNAASTVANNVQDLGKSQAQQAELAARRASGEATNKFDAMLKGQEWDSVKGGVEKVDGEWAGKESWVSAANNLADTVKNSSATLAGMGAAATQSVGAITNIVQTTSIKDLTGFGSDTTINDKIAHHQEKKATEANERANAAAKAAYEESNAGKNAAYREQNNATNQLYSNMQAQQSEVKNLQNQKAGAEAAVKQNCADESSALCQASKAQLSATEAALSDKQTQLAETEKQYGAAKEELDNRYKAALESNIAEAKTSYDAATSKANEECGKDSASAACATARRKALEAANQYSSYVTEKEKQTNAGRYETKEQVDTKIAENATVQERKRQDEKMKYEEEQAARQLQNEASNAKREYEQAVDNASNLYTQMNAQEKEAQELEQQAKAKAAEAQKACSRNSESSVCTTAQTAAKAAKEAADNKKEQAQRTKSEYTEAKSHAETAYNKSVTAGAAQAQRDYDNAVNQQQRAKEIIAAADAQMGEASEQAKSAETDYNASMKEAQEARKAYQEAQTSGKSDEEIKRLKAEYDAKLDAKAAAEKEYQQKSKAYNDLKQQKKDAEESYNNAYTKAKDAGEKLAAYTNENVNKTGESRLDSREDVDNQALVNQYKSDTNPVALAQASKNSYIEHKNNADVAGERLKEKRAIAAQAKQAYEDAVKKANESGSETDRRAADRLKNNYTLAENEVKAAEQDYEKAVNELSGYEEDYVKKAKEAETYKQSVYEAQMKQASADINQYEAAVNKQRKVVDEAARAYTQAKSAASDNNSQKVQKAALLYDEYKAAKETYDGYVKSLKHARNNYADAQKKYQESKAAQKNL